MVLLHHPHYTISAAVCQVFVTPGQKAPRPPHRPQISPKSPPHTQCKGEKHSRIDFKVNRQLKDKEYGTKHPSVEEVVDRPPFV